MPAPSSDGGSSGSSSPNLMATLRNFRMQNHKSYPRTPSNTFSQVSQPQSSSIDDSPESCRSGIEIPETPEYRRIRNFESGCEGPDSTTSPRKEYDNQPLNQRLAKYRYSPASGSSDSTTDSIMKESKEQAKEEYDEFCGKERCLKELLKVYPGADIMEAQDVLVRTDWNLTAAFELAKKLPLKQRKKAQCASQKGIKFEDELSDDNVSELESVQNLDQDLDSDDGIYVVATVTNSVNGTNNSETALSRKRKKVQIISDSEDEDGVAPLQSYVKDDEQQQPIVSDGSQHPSSKFSVLEYKPSSSCSLSDLSFQSVSGSSKEINTYSRTKPKQPISPRSIDSFDSNPLHVEKPCRRRIKDGASTSKKQNKTKSSNKRRRKVESDLEDEIEEEYGNNDVYDSEDSDGGETLTPARNAVLLFFQEARIEELVTIPGCSNRKAEAIISCRPFASWGDLVRKFSTEKMLSTDLLNGAKKVLDMRTAVSRLMNKCQKIAMEMEDLVEALKENKDHGTDYVSKQPDLLNPKMHLTSYQMLGLNWLLLMHNQEVNGILADEMGLGKTVQAIAFLSYLKQQKSPGPHLIVVPSSTLDNWKNELRIWWPSVSVLCYHGSQESRRDLRMKIIEDEIEDFDVMVTTYNMVSSSAEDRNFFKKLEFEYVIFDEAHMLKNMASQRYQHLMRVRASRRLLLTGTPLQNNLVELMSLLIFAVPHMFSGKTEQVKQMFSTVCKTDEGRSKFERDRIEHAKRIMKPFVLRRLKSEVLKDLPTKHEEIRLCPMTSLQSEKYKNLVKVLSDEVRRNKEEDNWSTKGGSMLMQLRKAANHQLLLRYHYTDEKLIKMSKLMLKEPTHRDANADLIFEDMGVMSDFELHRLCKQYKSLKSHTLSDKQILDSGKFAQMDILIPKMLEKGDRILLFSQFTMVLDIVEEYMKIRNLKCLRLDGQIPVSERQQLIDEYNQNQDIPIFLLSTRAGGLGINLTAANVVLIHDIDFNPYNDKQAEDRCHRVGQTRDVRVIRMISEGTIEEGMLQRADEKLKLEKDITSNTDDEEKDSGSVAKLLRDALGLSQPSKS